LRLQFVLAVFRGVSMRLRTLALLAAFLLPLPMMADTTYYYTGTDFGVVTGSYTTSDSINGWFSVASPLPANLNNAGGLDDITSEVTAFSFSDGVQTLTNSTPGVQSQFAVVTDNNADIYAWLFGAFIKDAGGNTIDEIASTGLPPSAEEYAFINYANDEGITFTSGTWSSSSSSVTPEPSSLILLLTGMSGIAGVVRRKLSRA
jgi:hypothetical protein